MIKKNYDIHIAYIGDDIGVNWLITLVGERRAKSTMPVP
jgi:hypothetical protein